MGQNRVSYLSMASVFAAFAVIILHTNNCFWEDVYAPYWISSNIIETAMYCAVPIYFMITGATLIDYKDRYSTKCYFKKRIEKVLIPFIAWSCIGITYCVWKGTAVIEPTLRSIYHVLVDYGNMSLVFVYWFFIPLFGVYLCIPLFASVEKNNRERLFTYIIIVSFVFNYLIPFFFSVINSEYFYMVKVAIGSEYLIYILLGYVLSKKELCLFQRLIIYCFSAIGFFIQLIGTHIVSTAAGDIVEKYRGYTNLPCLLYSVGVFVLIKQIGSQIKNKSFISLTERLSKYTFASYLLHWYIIDMINRIFVVDITSTRYRVIMPGLVLGISIIITWVIRKIPILRKILP